MIKQTSNTKVRYQHLKALCDLSDVKQKLDIEKLTTLINDSPDPESAIETVFKSIEVKSEALELKWRQLILELWSSHHPHIPVLLDLPITTKDTSEVIAVQDSLAFLQFIEKRPALMIEEGKEWLLDSNDASAIASTLPSQQGKTQFPMETEWQLIILKRLRETLQSLRLVRRVNSRLMIVKSRYERFAKLPSIQQFYLLWHTEAYHVDWSEFSGIWDEYVHIVQEYMPILWEMTANSSSDMPFNIRQWNQEMWDVFYPLWEDEGLTSHAHDQTALLSIVRMHSVPTAITQVVMHDLFERYGLAYQSNGAFYWSKLGIKLFEAERTQELACALDLLK